MTAPITIGIPFILRPPATGAKSNLGLYVSFRPLVMGEIVLFSLPNASCEGSDMAGVAGSGPGEQRIVSLEPMKCLMHT
jgi:hypothetical protein